MPRPPLCPQPGPVTEVDGAVATDFFTVLSTAQRFSEDQWLNVQAFSMLRAWLQLSGPGGPGAPDTGGTWHAPGDRPLGPSLVVARAVEVGQVL